MTKIITTEDCKKALEQAWPPILQQECPAQSGNWKRVAKRGKKGETIVRTFFHKALPLQALVTEVNGAITGTLIKGLAPFDIDQESEGLAETLAMLGTNESWKFLENHDFYKPEDFVFFVPDTLEEGEDTWFVITPLSYWKRTGHMLCEQMDYIVQRHLPEFVSEMEEGTFVIDMSPADLRAELLRRGFVQDPAFDVQMSGA